VTFPYSLLPLLRSSEPRKPPLGLRATARAILPGGNLRSKQRALLPLQVLAHASSTGVATTGGTPTGSRLKSGDPFASRLRRETLLQRWLTTALPSATRSLLKRSGFPATGLAPTPPHTAPAEPAKLPPDQTHTPPVYPIAETD